MEERREFLQHVATYVHGDGTGVVEAKEVLRYAANEEVRACLVRDRPSGVECGSFLVPERPQQDLRGASAEQGARLAEHIPLHEPEVGAAEDEDDVAGGSPMAIPAVLEFGNHRGLSGRDPLELVQCEDQLATGMGLGPLIHDGEQRLLPVVDP